jgi:hypothetical protein
MYIVDAKAIYCACRLASITVVLANAICGYVGFGRERGRETDREGEEGEWREKTGREV